MRCLSWVSAWRRMRLCPCGRDSTLYGHRRVTTTDIRPRRTLPFTLGLRLALWWCLLSRWVLELLADGRLARLIMIVLVPKSQLLIRTGIALPGILPLVRRQRRRRRSGGAVPAIPTTATLFPITTPVLSPVGRPFGSPAAKVLRRLSVVANRDSQHEERHPLRGHNVPRPVVPGTGVPAILCVHPVQTVVEEEVRVQLRGVVDRVARYRHKIGVGSRVDSDAKLSGRAGARA